MVRKCFDINKFQFGKEKHEVKQATFKYKPGQMILIKNIAILPGVVDSLWLGVRKQGSAENLQDPSQINCIVCRSKCSQVDGLTATERAWVI